MGCKIHKGKHSNEQNIFNNTDLNRTKSEIVSFNLKYEPNLLNIVNNFKIKNNNTELEDKVIFDFLELQYCHKNGEKQFQDYPNELQIIYEFYNSMNKELFDWLNNKELTILKFTSIKFIVNNVNDVAAFEHMKNQLNNCKNDNEYAKLVMSSSNLNECFEK